jgi:hypothetical protein
MIKESLRNNQPERTMNTDTPRTNEWETYCDESYYHLWRVRRKNERGFNDGYHVHNGDEARALVDLLNKQDTELTAVTEQRDRLADIVKKIRAGYGGQLVDPDCDCSDCKFLRPIDEALQSLTTNSQDHG